MCKPRCGFALFSALIITLLLFALASGLALADHESAIRSADALTRTALRARAETLADSLFDAIDWTAASGMPIGGQTRLDIGGTTRTIVFLSRLDPTTYWIVTRAFVGTEGRPSSELRIGLAITSRPDGSGRFRALRIPNRSWSELY